MNEIKKIINKLLDIMFVKKCVACNELLNFDCEEYMCEDCAEEWSLAKTEVCPRCLNGQVGCRCGFYGSPLDSVRHLALYSPLEKETVTNRLVYALKRSNNDDVFDFVAREMTDNLISKIGLENTVCVGVPRTPAAVRKHGYDHAKKLAKKVSDILGIEYVDILAHNGGKIEQKKLKRHTQRLENARKNCYIKQKNVERIKGRKILLIDDIGTTGAMASTCAGLLKQNGALRVDCVLCARNENHR